MEQLQRLSGIILHPTSLPSPYGIGDLGDGAYRFIDFLHESGQHLWQLLPLTPTGYGDSPYQGPSAFAGQPLLISPEKLLSLNLLSSEDLSDAPDCDPRRVDYGRVIPWKTAVLEKAFEAFKHTPDKTLLEEYEAFCEREADWLDDYALFMALKDAHGGISLLDWEPELKNPSRAALIKLREQYAEPASYYCFLQFIFEKQWQELLGYAHENEVQIIGDIPIFVSADSADVWSHKELFQLDEEGRPKAVAGVPPDYFSETGQLWGNPLYDWERHEKSGYAWWIRRVKRQLTLTDYLRIDHFRGFEAYWSVPAGEKTAINGQWIKGPCEKLFLAISKALGEDLPILAEDLGVITPEVEHLRDSMGFPGMKVLQFGFENPEDRSYIPFYYTGTNCVCYTGTHDNDTTVGWYAAQSDEVKERICEMTHTDGSDIGHEFIRIAMGSIAKFSIFPLQDLLELGSEARMNTPGVAAGNWAFRFCEEDLTEELKNWLKKTTRLYGRCEGEK